MSDNMQPIDEILDDESPDAKATEAYDAYDDVREQRSRDRKESR